MKVHQKRLIVGHRNRTLPLQATSVALMSRIITRNLQMSPDISSENPGTVFLMVPFDSSAAWQLSRHPVHPPGGGVSCW